MAPQVKPEIVTSQDLANATVEIPGEGPRILMCFFLTGNDAASDGITIVAMADSQETLLERVLEEGMQVRRHLRAWSGGIAAQDEFGIREGWGAGRIVVLDTPPASIRSVSLESHDEMTASIDRLRGEPGTTLGWSSR